MWGGDDPGAGYCSAGPAFPSTGCPAGFRHTCALARPGPLPRTCPECGTASLLFPCASSLPGAQPTPLHAVEQHLPRPPLLLTQSDFELGWWRG